MNFSRGYTFYLSMLNTHGNLERSTLNPKATSSLLLLPDFFKSSILFRSSSASVNAPPSSEIILPSLSASLWSLMIYLWIFECWTNVSGVFNLAASIFKSLILSSMSNFFSWVSEISCLSLGLELSFFALRPLAMFLLNMLLIVHTIKM